jgi:Short C-terminal domain
MSATRKMWAGFGVFIVLFFIFDSGEATYHWSRGLVWGTGIGSGVAFLYAMYVFYFDVTRGDKHLQKRGIQGTAVVLSAKQTHSLAQTGQFDFQAPFIWKYRLRVTIPGKDPYEANCGVARSGIDEGSTVRVAVSRFSKRSVTILADQETRRADARASGIAVTNFGGDSSGREQKLIAALQAAQAGTSSQPFATAPAAADSGISAVDALAKLSELHQSGALTDAEFATEKGRILSR